MGAAYDEAMHIDQQDDAWDLPFRTIVAGEICDDILRKHDPDDIDGVALVTDTHASLMSLSNVKNDQPRQPLVIFVQHLVKAGGAR